MKKKGLIISTIVMVVVLIASLTTATYAWFNSQAQAKVQNISLTTVTAEGLQVAVDNGSPAPEGYSQYVSGDISFDGNFTGTVDDWSELVNFQNISTTLGNISSAVTRVTAANVSADLYDGKVYTSVGKVTSEAFTADHTGYYKVGQSAGLNAMVASGDEWEDVVYYTVASDPAEGTYLSPIGYNLISNVLTPYAYTVANENGTNGYLNLPIAVRPTEDMKAVVCTMTISPKKNQAAVSTWNNYKPGMAAAIRIRISDGTNTIEVEPYHNVVKANSAFTGKTEDAFILNFVVAYGDGLGAYVATLDPLSLTYTVWIEGTDGECIDIVTGTGAQVDLAYDYIGSDNNTAELEEDAEDVTTALTAIGNGTSVTFSSAPTAYIRYNAKNYFVFNFTSEKAAPVTP